ncbi:hypothetical protein KIN20_026990 [Parelaphostrongylus tenuis]|uniref:Uncharacterized protein n=1 Tax=Parelaphostrongylus tenuis TaxID=148309 RepID=A0AAD5WDD2_PARTN|nr:hypothetical protein KIN20_026990 [Parelaphostrongylus tenuis]
MNVLDTTVVRSFSTESDITFFEQRYDSAAGKVRCHVIGLMEARRRHPLHAAASTKEDTFLEHPIVKVSGVSVLVKTTQTMNTDSVKQLTNRIERLWLMMRFDGSFDHHRCLLTNNKLLWRRRQRTVWT